MTRQSVLENLKQIVETHDRVIWKLSGQMRWVLGLLGAGVMTMIGSLGVQYLQLQKTIVTQHIAAKGAAISAVSAERAAEANDTAQIAVQVAGEAADKAEESLKKIDQNVLPNVRAVRKKLAPLAPPPAKRRVMTPSPVTPEERHKKYWGLW